MNIARLHAPLLIGAIAVLALAIGVGAEGEGKTEEALLVMGAMLLGAWIALVAAGGHTGFTPLEDEDDDA